MTKILAFVGFLALVVGLCIYMGWLGFSSSDNAKSLELKLDKTEIKDDVTKAEKKIEELGRAAEEKVKNAAAEVKNRVDGNK